MKSVKPVGYHIAEIKKGVCGESSKILEEVHELIDAEAQGCRIMQLVELSDLFGAIELYLKRHYPGMDIADLSIMSMITHRAFKSGHRK